ncbi:MAG: hypothetical protein ACAH59_05180 [Pseudobdellovibrionaceae bacterium]
MEFIKLFITFLFVSQGAVPPQKTWPREMTLSDGGIVSVFYPQVESLTDQQVKARAAFKLKEKDKEYYGSFVLEAETEVSKDQNLVTLRKLKVKDLQIPDRSEKRQMITQEIEKKINEKESQISYQSLLDNLKRGEIEKQKIVDLQNKPPNIIFKKEPSFLILISGEPKWEDSRGAEEVRRVINTSALILNQEGKNYYLWGMNRWFSAPDLKGPWKQDEKGPSSKFVIIKDRLIKEGKVDPLEPSSAGGKNTAPSGTIPQFVVVTEPTELLQSLGDPKYDAIPGTSLFYVSNSPNSIFLEKDSKTIYVLISGRWFSAKNPQGPWKYVPGKELPKDFAKIPTDSPAAQALVSVPGTVQAKEAFIASQIPQTAKVKRDLQPKSLSCDGKAQWADIEKTKLKYARNCNSPLIQVSEKEYLLLQDGVWFTSASTDGPWKVATKIPNEIEKIPSSSPLHYVSYVHIYNVTDEEVTVGYTPGYHGAFASNDGTVVYGTGYTYPSYVSETAWYPSPWTYGFGVGYGWGYYPGFYMGVSVGSFMYPWGWGTCCYGSSFVNVDVTNTYRKWGTTSVVTGPGGQRVGVATAGNTRVASAGTGEVYARHDGQVYRHTEAGDWQRYVGPGSWETTQAQSVADLDSMHTDRASEIQSTNRAQPSFNASSSAARPMPRLNGGFHGGRFGR